MPERLSATCVVSLHPAPEHRLTAWLDRTTAAARSMPGFESLQRSTDGGGLTTAVAATFDTAEHLHAWMDSPGYAHAFTDTDGVLRQASDLLIVEGARLPPGTAVFRHDVIPERTAEFVAAEQVLAKAIGKYPGFCSLTVFPPAPGQQHWISILRFHTDEQLSGWMASEERVDRLPALRMHLVKDFDILSVDAPFGSILRIKDGKPRVTPKWRTAMLILLVLYPTVMTLNRFFVPILDDLGAHPWLSTWLSQAVCVSAMTFLLMPSATRLFTRWLDPVEGSSVRVSTLGALAVVTVYALCLWVFATVGWLQFWQHP